ncbi:zincin-like metallopeptidase domain-containing protein [Selenomonas sp. AB3002]|uniref:zincin-like metallopeptidase domain-containing protein n=1 Tax=Selenomonas sp. AB3002 TaxID=1392502 RepID=UPI00068D8883
MATEKMDYYQEVTNDIIKAIEEGTTPWQQGWDSKVGAAIAAVPMNGKTERPYYKDNLLRLSIVMKKHGDSQDPRFFTFKQAKDMGYSIKKGAKSTLIRMGFYADKDLEGNELPEDEKHWTNRYYRVFHASDCCLGMTYVKDEQGNQEYAPVYDKEGKPVLVPGKDKDGNTIMEPKMEPVIKYEPIPEYVPKAVGYTHDDQIEIAEAMLKNSGAKIFNDQANRAYYSPSQDEIHLPKAEAFPEIANYYATALHELGHWTGHSSRLNRFGAGSTNFGSSTYAKEELRAELASTFLSADLGIPMNTQNHAAYVKSWLQALKNDKTEIFKAANDASKIARYLEDFVRDLMKEKSQHKDVEETKEEVKAAEAEKAQVTKEKPVVAETVKETPAPESPTPAKAAGKLYVAIHQLKEGSDWHFSSWEEASKTHSAKNPLDFKAYEQKWQETYEAKGENVSAILENIYTEHNADDRPSGQVMSSLSMSDVVQINERYFYVDSIGFQELNVKPFKDKELMTPISNEKIEKTIAADREAIGAEKHDDYQKSFNEAYYAGSTVNAAGSGTVEEDYQKFIFENAQKYSLSSLRSADQAGWEKADEAFLMEVAHKSCKQKGYVDKTDLDRATITLFKLSPRMAVLEGDKQEYPRKLKENVLSGSFCKDYPAPKEEAVVR